MSRRRVEQVADDAGAAYSYDIKIWAIRRYEGKKRSTYQVRWAVNGEEKNDTFATHALADAFRSKLVSYQRKGVAFHTGTGLPEPMMRERSARSWYEHICRYVNEKWDEAAPKSRKSIADALATVTPVLLKPEKRGMSDAVIREAVYGWICVKPLRVAGNPPKRLVPVLEYLEQNAIDMTLFNDRTAGPEATRRALAVLGQTLDGKSAARTTYARKRAVFYNSLEFGIEDGILTFNPIDRIKIKRQGKKATRSIDHGSVVSLDKGLRLLEEVGKQGDMGQRLVPFFGSMLFAALRPAEALRLAKPNLKNLPEDDDWGDMVLGRSMPRSGVAWSNTGRSREERSLKHRDEHETRPVPIHPLLVRIFHTHLKEFRVGSAGWLFVGPRGGTPDESTYLRIWDNARSAALTPDEYASGLAKRPYDLRHFAISFWLSAGIPAAHVALWAGNSPAVIWAVYAKVIQGMESDARRRVDDATAQALKRRVQDES